MSCLKAIVDRFEGEKAVIIFSDGQKLIIDRKNLIDSIKPGDAVYVSLTLDRAETATQENLARNILKEILKKEDV